MSSEPPVTSWTCRRRFNDFYIVVKSKLCVPNRTVDTGLYARRNEGVWNAKSRGTEVIPDCGHPARYYTFRVYKGQTDGLLCLCSMYL